MFDYQYGTSTKKYKEKIQTMMPRLSISKSLESKSLSLVYRFLSGLEIITICSVNRLWYSASWDATLWRELSNQLSDSETIDKVYNLLSSKFSKFENKLESKGIKDAVLITNLKTTRWKLTYVNILYKFCCNCQNNEPKLRFLPILQKSLCFKCAKLPEFSMISLENAEVEYKVTKEQISEHQLDGLRVPHTNESGKYMFVYYLSDILWIVNGRSNINIDKSQVIRTNIQERRRTELVYYMKQEGIDDESMNKWLNTEGTYANNFMLGKSKMSSSKIAKMMGNHFRSQKKGEKTEGEACKKKKFTVLTEDEIIVRKLQLIERLTLMGLNTETVDFNSKNSLAYSFIRGRTNKDIGMVAGSIWREYKPVFTGISSKTTQRKEDI